VSPDRGGRKASGKGGGRRASKRPSGPAAARRLGLLIFGVAFGALFAIVAISEGVGDPSVPSGDVILVEDAPGDSGEISQEDFDHALEIAAAESGQKKVPKPSTKQYEEVKEAATTSLVEFAWLAGQAAEMGVTVSEQEVAKELKKIKKENFPTEAEFQAFLKESKFTQEDVDRRVEFTIITNELQEILKEDPPTPSESEIEAYYEAAKASQFTQPPTRDVRLIVNKDQQKAEQALAQLEKGNTAKDWAKAAKEFSEDPGTKGKGGLQKAVTEGTLEEPVDAAVFAGVEGQLEGPVKGPKGFTIFEVQNSSPETVQELNAVEGQIESQLSQQLEQEDFTAFIADYNNRWVSRTFCASDYVTERCSNYESDGHPSTAPAACYEADPDGGRPEACPAPVFQLVPAQPGSVTPLAPQGKPLAQRPTPPGGGEAAPEGAPGEQGAPGAGAAPPPSEAPPSEAPPSEAPPSEAPPSE
jgi:parvulin-like peptidyl-prolyl isomerase